ncbi:protein toll-like [Spodoptera litura]|uniref:Protein toll-like n=1 Tax=Spodoptera litura TaxID=69820 RepID=A0A9J7EDF8_SPOLT|nr:protein toll-like [Spodoptera litura]
MYRKVIYAAVAALTLQIIGAARLMCPSDPNCVCGGTLAVELNCNIDGRTVKINLLPNIYINIKCENASSLDYSKLPKCANNMSSFKSVSFKDCPLPASSFKDVLSNMGVSKTMALIFQNAKNLSGYFDRKHFAGLQDLTKLLLSINGITHLPDNLFMDINKLTWLNIRSNTINLSEELFKPLEKLETLEISHNHMTNISSNLFSHLSFLRKLSLWQSNVTWFSKDLFTGVDVLEELDLSSNGLNELPASIFKPLKKLKKLTLFSNKFFSLPQNLFRNNAELETVVILNNDVKLKELPKYLFGDLPNLKQIYIQRSGLENLPYDVFANSPVITNISLAYNDITTLPEAIFNDQINLLELDLSYNQLSELKPKLFSSLVRLERLKLCHNSLVEISGQTFSSLLSLIYLEMEHNNLKTISPYLFSNNKQRMSISLAYNQLDFEDKELTNNSWLVKRASSFAHTYNLKLLNLSHNEFKVAFEDWWVNGHENLDISHNNIQNLWTDEKALKDYRNVMKKGMKSVWISKNPINCGCENYLFMDFLLYSTRTKIVDLQHVRCPLWAKEACYMRFTILITLMTVVISIYTIILVVFIIYRKQINSIVKKRLSTFHRANAQRKEKSYRILMDFCHQDEEFVNREMLSIMTTNESLQILTKVITDYRNSEFRMSKNFKRYVKDVKTRARVVVFSSNYLTETYGHIDIKKIHSEMLKAEKTIYIFADIGPDNSIYDFLEEQRDLRTTLKWNEENFWPKLYALLKSFVSSDELKKVEDTLIVPGDSLEPSKISLTNTPDWPNMYDFNTLTHSQV